MTSSSETSREMDPESLEIGLLGPAIPVPRNVLRSAILVLRAGHVFFSKAYNDKKETLDSPRVLLSSSSQRHLDSLHAFGGVRGIAEVFETDLENGITGEIEDLSRRRTNAIYKTTVPAARNFLELLMKSSNRHTIFLLIVSVALSLGFGITEEGPGTGWYEGVLIILAIIILVIVPAVRDFLFVSSQH